MAISKRELMGFLTEEQNKEVEALESHIDKRLKTSYVPGGRVIVELTTNYPNERVRLELIRRYREQGWEIFFHSDQRDGSWIELR